MTTMTMKPTKSHWPGTLWKTPVIVISWVGVAWFAHSNGWERIAAVAEAGIIPYAIGFVFGRMDGWQERNQ